MVFLSLGHRILERSQTFERCSDQSQVCDICPPYLPVVVCLFVCFCCFYFYCLVLRNVCLFISCVHVCSICLFSLWFVDLLLRGPHVDYLFIFELSLCLAMLSVYCFCLLRRYFEVHFACLFTVSLIYNY